MSPSSCRVCSVSVTIFPDALYGSLMAACLIIVLALVRSCGPGSPPWLCSLGPLENEDPCCFTVALHFLALMLQAQVVESVDTRFLTYVKPRLSMKMSAPFCDPPATTSYVVSASSSMSPGIGCGSVESSITCGGTSATGRWTLNDDGQISISSSSSGSRSPVMSTSTPVLSARGTRPWKLSRGPGMTMLQSQQCHMKTSRSLLTSRQSSWLMPVWHFLCCQWSQASHWSAS